mmetsp:Transcript_10892/g.18893  ORF Transcript_10892/g.18893 Transcript_10892/m.18893 type:complete len:397 (-) Transcript_10892:1559-2749(-)|eukprot:CAMPEP_0119106336 /NCGR_PEP_ID=MMETSP1180-20130426/4056_1 /TAXON_ID=3052 ORGANISM="Chlamydomonas cf sp, Strain CCMP681" /NCGR_SAMPLE_ID=MMETSP1180 /ASSEMBLY_ACC=CAM_ASM_000741 /LENGTH=396 /DNA_ID=CAMNT_0007091653 /DNA_START=60 /DNA_END=1250 /DNA_ORIENTATION=+
MGNSASSNSLAVNRLPAVLQHHPSQQPQQPYGAYPPAPVYTHNGAHQGAYNYYVGYQQSAYGPPGQQQGPYQQQQAPNDSRSGPATPYGPYTAPPQTHTHEYQKTSTIRNQVNLKKGSLALERTARDSQAHRITFTFDASADCRVATFVLAREDTRQSCKITTSVPVSPYIIYEQKLEHKFPPDGLPAGQHCIDLARVSVEDLLAASTADTKAPPVSVGQQVFPLIVRLEALTDEGRAEGRTMRGLEPGCALPPWVQSQTTYAKVIKDEDGTLHLRVLKQKIWVKGESYELQEIFGIEQNRGLALGTPTTAEGFEDVEGNECVICMSAARDTAALPCRHMCLCHTCAGQLRTQTNKCPICREPIESLLHIKIHKHAIGDPLADSMSSEAGPSASKA